MRSEIGVEEGETILKEGKAPPEAVSGRATYTTAAAILYAGLAAGVLRERGVHRDESVLTMLFVTVRTIAYLRSSKGQSP